MTRIDNVVLIAAFVFGFAMAYVIVNAINLSSIEIKYQNVIHDALIVGLFIMFSLLFYGIVGAAVDAYYQHKFNREHV